MRVAPPMPATIERLAEHRTLSQVPRSELEWLVTHGHLRYYNPGDYIVRKGQSVDEAGMGLQFVLAGRFGHTVDRGTGPRKVMEWQAGDVSGVLPFSRMTSSIGESIAEVDVETFNVDPVHFPALIRECPTITAICVHVMVDRARVFNSSDWQDEKLMSLGRLAAGLAHELNNPASAVARSAKALSDSMAEADRAARVLAVTGLSETQLAAVDHIRNACTTSTVVSRSPLERADREDEIANWLLGQGVDTSAVAALAETGVTLDELSALAREIQGDDLDAALDWVAAGCAVRIIAAEIEKAASRIYDLVAAVKGFTHMDRAHVPEPVEIERGLRDTLMVLAHKARRKSVSVSVEIAPDLPRVHAIGGELNQVWMNLIDNALDAVSPAGRVKITAEAEGRYAIVRVIDDGPGIPDEIKKRIFDPFFTTKEVGEGTGMGLETALRAVRGHGGNIDFDSRPGRTEFRVSLPLADDQPQKRGGPAAAARV